jgi:hypothetical protein
MADKPKFTLVDSSTLAGSVEIPPVAGGGGGPHDGDMEARIAKLEAIAEKTSERLGTLESDVAVIKTTMATKSDLTQGFADTVKWMVGTAIGIGVAAITVGTFVLNNASPKAPAAQAQPPIIINVPSAAAPATPAPAVPAPPTKP